MTVGAVDGQTPLEPVPFGRSRTVHYVKGFSSYAPVLADWESVSTDFEQLDLRPGDFVYPDPPYERLST